MGFCAWISKLFGRSVASVASVAVDHTSIEGNSYEVFTQAIHGLYYRVLAGIHPGTILEDLNTQLAGQLFPIVNPTFADRCRLATYRMLGNLEKNGSFDRFLTFDQYNLLNAHPERIRYANDLYTYFKDFPVFKNAIMDPEMAEAMENSKKKMNNRFERRLRVDADRQDAQAKEMFDNNTAFLEQMDKAKMDNPPPAYSPAIPGPPPVHDHRAVPVAGPGRYSVLRTSQGPPAAIPRLPGRLSRYPGQNSAPQSDRPDPLAFPYDEYGREAAYRELAELEERERIEGQLTPFARAVNTGRNSHNRPNPVNVALLPPRSLGA